jgi:hypothetical protein
LNEADLYLGFNSSVTKRLVAGVAATMFSPARGMAFIILAAEKTSIWHPLQVQATKDPTAEQLDHTKQLGRKTA